MEKQYIGNITFPYQPPALKPEEEKVFFQLRIRKAMPTYEIAGITGIYGPELTNTIAELAKKQLVTISPSGSATDNIVTISGKFF